mgnify:FL=1
MLLACTTSLYIFRNQCERRICNGDCTVRTCFFTFLTSDTSEFTCSCNGFSLCMRATANKCFLIIWCKFNQMMRTFCNTFTAGLTGFTVNNCYSVYNMNCIKRTSFYTASKSHTSIIACFGSAAWNECHHSQSSTPV